MSETKIQSTLESFAEGAREAAGHFAIVAMAAATIIGMTELAERNDVKAVAQPAYAFAGGQAPSPVEDMAMRKEKEEVAHRPISYGTTMRSEAVSGKQ